MLQGYVATTPGMGHQQAARLFAGMSLSMHEALKCARQQQGEQGTAQDAAAAFGAHCYLNLVNPPQVGTCANQPGATGFQAAARLWEKK